MTQIYDNDTWRQISKKIFELFEVNQSCSIYGYEIIGNEVYPKGELVVKELIRLDREENVCVSSLGKNSRRRKILPDSIGGYVAHKIFRFKKFNINDEQTGKQIKYVIWRVQ